MIKPHKYNAKLLKNLLIHPNWQDYELFVHSLILEKLTTNVSKEVLIGMKLTIDELKRFIATHDKD